MDNLNFPSGMEWLESRTILLTYTGSKAYGTFIEGQSDEDFKGVCIPPVDFYFGLKAFNEYNTTGGKNFKNTKDDIDVSIMHINKFVADAMQGVPNNIEILFVNPEHIISINKFGEELLSHRRDFLTKALKHKFGGYAHSQMLKLVSKQSNGTGRQDLIEKYGYDTKFYMHGIRLLTSAIEILTTGDFHTYRQNRRDLIACRNGRETLEQAIARMHQLDVELNFLYFTSDKVPNSPDYNKINTWLIDLNKRAMQEGWE